MPLCMTQAEGSSNPPDLALMAHVPDGKQESRRRFVVAAGAAGLAAFLAGCTSAGPIDGSSEPASDTPFGEPEVLDSANGVLEVTLRAEIVDLPWRGWTRVGFGYNGSTPGPTLRVRPGDQLIVHLENALDDDTNLHSHGLHVSPEADGDNVFARVSPGESRTYRYNIPPDHRSGLFWYHPHAHGTVARQVAAGLAGAIIVVDGLDDIDEIASSTERLWILSDPPVADSVDGLGAGAMDRMVGREGDVILVNGIEQPSIVTAAGALERWRILNASSSRYYRLMVDGHPLHLIGSDGGRIDVPVAVEEILLAPGERIEALLAPAESGTFAVRSLPYDRGGMGGMMGGDNSSDEIVLGTVVVTGNGSPASLPEALLDPGQLTVPAATAAREMELAMGMGGGMMGGDSGGMMSFTIDGETFDPQRVDIPTTLGAVEEWTIRNSSPMDHPLHLHVWPFLVIDGQSGSGWKDTINVPAGREVRIVVPFSGIGGRTVYHCHILDHEDLGMMGVIDVAR